MFVVGSPEYWGVLLVPGVLGSGFLSCTNGVSAMDSLCLYTTRWLVSRRVTEGESPNLQCVLCSKTRRGLSVPVGGVGSQGLPSLVVRRVSAAAVRGALIHILDLYGPGRLVGSYL